MKPPPSDGEGTRGTGATRIDLGDDLIENTATLTIQGPRGTRTPVSVPDFHEDEDTGAVTMPSGQLTPEQISDQMHSARILMGEGILEDAKRVLRKVLLSDSSLVEARRMLEEIHETELRQIFVESEVPRHRLRRAETPSPVEMSADIVLRGLDRDLRLGLFTHDEVAPPDPVAPPQSEAEAAATQSVSGSIAPDHEPAINLPPPPAKTAAESEDPTAPQLSLFKDRAAMNRFGEQMDRDFGGRPAVDRIDLGVAFLEMGLPDLAVRHFQAAVNRLTLDELNNELDSDETKGDPVLAATGLLAHALIQGGRAFEATIKLQTLLNDVEIEKARKLDLIYLMGRAFESMGKSGDALQWYAQAAEIEPHYRDLDEKLKPRTPAPGGKKRGLRG